MKTVFHRLRAHSPLLLGGFFVALASGWAAYLLRPSVPTSVPIPGDVLFYVVAGIAIAGAAGVAFSRDIIHTSLSLLATLLGSGALYVYLQADYVAVTQLLVYVGGVLVLILFAVMLTSRIGERSATNPSAFVVPGFLLLLASVGVLGWFAVKAPWQVAAPGAQSLPETALPLGDLFLKEYLLPFEVASLLLLATLVGAVVVAKKEVVSE